MESEKKLDIKLLQKRFNKIKEEVLKENKVTQKKIGKDN